jgi:putative sterol carrier protein
MNTEAIISGMQAKASSAPALGSTLKFDFGGETIYIDGTGGSNTVSADDKDADCTISVAKDDFIALTTGDLNPMSAFMSGKIKVSGDMSLAMKLQSLL